MAIITYIDCQKIVIDYEYDDRSEEDRIQDIAVARIVGRIEPKLVLELKDGKQIILRNATFKQISELQEAGVPIGTRGMNRIQSAIMRQEIANAAEANAE